MYNMVSTYVICPNCGEGHMIREEPFDEDVLDEAIVFINTSKQAARIRCATIGWNAADEILKDK